MTVGIDAIPTPTVARINGRPVLQPTCNLVPRLERPNSLKKVSPLVPPSPSPSPSPLPPALPTSATSPRTKALLTPPISPKLKSPRPPAVKRGNDPNGLNLSAEKIAIPKVSSKTPTLERKKSKSFKGIIYGDGAAAAVSYVGVSPLVEASLTYSSSLITEAPGSIAAGRREQMALLQAQRKMRIAHYGRSKSEKFEKVVPFDSSSDITTKPTEEEKRCSFITPNSGI